MTTEIVKDTSAIDVYLYENGKLYCGSIRVNKERLDDRLIMFNKPFVLVRKEDGWVAKYHYEYEAG